MSVLAGSILMFFGFMTLVVSVLMFPMNFRGLEMLLYVRPAYPFPPLTMILNILLGFLVFVDSVIFMKASFRYFGQKKDRRQVALFAGGLLLINLLLLFLILIIPHPPVTDRVVEM